MSVEKKVRQKIEDGIHECLDGDRKKNSLEFVAYLRANKLNPLWATPLSWKVSLKNEGVCYIKLFAGGRPGYNDREAGDWIVNPHGGFKGGYESIFSDDKGKEISWANIKYCIGCSKVCVGEKKWRRVSVLGREFDKVCKNVVFNWSNPDADTIEYIKKMIENRCNEIREFTNTR